MLATANGNLSLGSFAVTGGTTTLTTQSNAADISVTNASTSSGTIKLTSTRNITTGALTTTGAAADIVADATTAGTGAFSIGGATAVRDILIGTTTRPNTLTLGAATAGRNLTTRTTGASTYTGALSAALTDLLAGGALSGGPVSGTNGVTVVGQSINLASATTAAGSLAATATGSLSLGSFSVTGGTTTLTTQSNPADISVTNASTSTGAIQLTSTRSITTGGLTASGPAAGVTATAGAAGGISIASVNAAGAIGLTAGTGGIAVTGNAKTGAGPLTATSAAGVSLGSFTVAGGTTTLTANGGDTAVGAASTSTGAVTVKASGTARLAAVNATGTTIAVTASDADITGAQTASSVTLTNFAPANGSSLGDFATAPGSGFRLSAGEINFANADRLVIDGGTGAVQMGTVTFGAAAGKTSVDVLTTGALTVTGAVAGSGAGRTFRFGGNSGTGLAASIQIVPTATAGGRLLFDTANLDLRGERIGAGQSALLAQLFAGGGLSAADASSRFVTNPDSSLYNALVDGQAYALTARTVISANTLTVRYGTFALFQNTGTVGTQTGAVLGGTVAVPVVNALTLTGPGTTIPNTFSLFGSINGVGGTATAVLGSTIIFATGIDANNTRVNGCIIGSGSGCITTTVARPSLNVFDASRIDIFRSVDNFAVPFDPVIGGNNEALFAGVAAIDAPVAPVECDPGNTSAQCPAPQEKRP